MRKDKKGKDPSMAVENFFSDERETRNLISLFSGPLPSLSN